MDTIDCLTSISKNEKLFNGLYRAASCRYNLPEGSLWILYFLIFSDTPITQLDVAERMMLPKQTINSATMSLVNKGYVELQKIDGSKRKNIVLTVEGRKFTEETVRHILSAEKRAVERMGQEKIGRYMELCGEFYECMRVEFRKEGILDA